MRFIADLHIHSHFSRATSPNLDPEHIALWSKKKGITVVGTGDLTHPGWVSELGEKLIKDERGLYRLKPELEKVIEDQVPRSCRGPVRFLLSGEISCIYKKDGKTRKLHHLILMPDIGSVEMLNKRLDRIGNISSDGRPILGMDSRDLLELVLEVSDRSFFIPAHIWTPWFSLFGSRSGFDSMEECFGDLTSHIHALETGLSSDPPMNRCLSALDNYLLVSNSDAHSPSKLGREANIFETELDYDHMLQAMIQGDGFKGTIEFYPEEGKYHLDGHRKCQVRLHPRETKKKRGICPTCGKSLTIGVLHRVYELSDRETPKLSKDFCCLIPLSEILSEILDCGPSTKKVTSVYEDLLNVLGPELNILMDVPLKDIDKAGGILLSKAVERMRKDQVIRDEGYDGEYGTIHLFKETERHELAGQIALFRAPEKKTTKRKERLGLGEVSEKKIHRASEKNQASLSDPILDPLNPEQREAILYAEGHLLVVAGPGTGKTMTLAHRIAYLIHSEQAALTQILALTFTNKAAREMRERTAALLPDQLRGEIRVATFHGFCLHVLRNDGERLNLPTDFTVCSEMDASALAQQVISDCGEGKRVASKFLKRLPQLKMSTVMETDSDPSHHDLLPLFQNYQQRLRNLGMVDLDDLEVETLRLFKHHHDICREYGESFPKIFVDEYQDTNPIQVEILKSLVYPIDSPCALHPAPCAIHICAIGDPDQAIYGFRGADVGSFYRFLDDFSGAKEIVLSRNYRSTQIILKGSSTILGKKKALEGDAGQGDLISIAPCRTQSEEAEMIVEQIEKMMGGTSYFSIDSGRVSSHEEGENISFGDIAVLFRLNAQGDAFGEAFERAGIPFIRSGEKPLISQYPANIIWRLLQASQYPDNPYYLDTYLNLLDKDMGKGEQILGEFVLGGSLEELIDQAVSLHEFDSSSEESAQVLRRLREVAENCKGDMASFLDDFSLERGIDHVGLSGDRVALMSLHAAKGLEWPVVFITGCEDRLIPCSLFGDRDEAEEKRLLYVGMTRARRKLILCHAKRRKISGRMLQMKPSPFLELIPKKLYGPLERGKWKRKGKGHKQLELF